jgi:NADP-dependent 3-hydroxy acid dehydrogenase YdfG
VAVITGAGSGIGRLMAIKLSGMGVRVALWDISDSVKGVEDEIKKSGGDVK